MLIFKSLDELRRRPSPHAVAIGNFDGVHRGHRRILRILRDKALREDLVPLVLTFDPHPGKITGKGTIRLLQTTSQKLASLSREEIENVLLMPFDRELAGMSGRDFVRTVIVEAIQARVIVIGDHFRFGKDRSGDVHALERLARDFGLSVSAVPPLLQGGKKISSTLIRRKILTGDMETAAALLGRPHEIEGRVIRGEARGTGLGFPTANLSSPNEILPGGVFISRVLFDGRDLPALTNIGTRPTFGRGVSRIETHLLNFSGNLYDRLLSIRLLKKIRDEQPFDSPAALTRRIHRDMRSAREFFSEQPE